MARGVLTGKPRQHLPVSFDEVVGPPPADVSAAEVAAWQAVRAAKVFRGLREAAGLSRTALADEVSVHWRTIENVERAWTWPDFVTLVALSSRFDLDLMAGIDRQSGGSSVGWGWFERQLQDRQLPDALVVEVVFVRAERLAVRRDVDEWPALDDADVERLLAAGPPGRVSVEFDTAGEAASDDEAAGVSATMRLARPGDVSFEQAVAEATGLLRRVFDDVAVLQVSVMSGIDDEQLLQASRWARRPPTR